MVKSIFPKKNDYNNIRTQCAPDTTGFLSDVYKRNTRAQKTRALETACSEASKVVSSGRSMIEMLGVLAIIGVLSVGGIAGYSKAMTKFKINKTMQQIAEIATNVQTLYIQQKSFNGLNNETAIQMGVIPDDLKTGEGEYGASITNVFGSPVNVYHDYYVDDDNSFNIKFLNITKEGCIALATADWGNFISSGLVAIGSRKVSIPSDCIEHVFERRILNNGYKPQEVVDVLDNAIFRTEKINPTRYKTLQELSNQGTRHTNSAIVGKIRDGEHIFVKTGYKNK